MLRYFGRKYLRGKILWCGCMFAAALFIFSRSAAAQELKVYPVPLPTTSNVQQFGLVSDTLGYIYTKDGSIYKYMNGRWLQLPAPEESTPMRIFIVGEDDIWAIGKEQEDYGQKLLHFRDGNWHTRAAPNVDPVSALYFEDPEHGWMGCEWGEILRFEEGEWRHVYSPTRCHVVAFVEGPEGALYARTDCSHLSCGEILAWDGKQWQIIARLDRLEYLQALGRNRFLIRQGPSYSIFENGHLTPILEPPARFNIAVRLLRKVGADDLAAWIDKAKRLSNQLPEFLKGSKVSLSPQGEVWFYSSRAGLWSFSEHVGTAYANKPEFSIQPLTGGHVLGVAFLQAEAGRNFIYLVDGEGPNFLVPMKQHNDIYLQLQVPSINFGLAEPAETWQGNKNYDLAVLTADFNGDEREDVFVSSLYSENALFLNLGRGNFKNIARWAGLTGRPGRYGIAATADIDNDGDLDLFLPDELGPSLLFANNGCGQFSDISNRAQVHIPKGAKAAAFADIDADGWIDLAVTTYGEGTFIFRNRGKGIFEDISNRSPALRPFDPGEKASSLTFADYDNDGDLDLYICKLRAGNRLLENDGSGTFTDVTAKVGLLDSARTSGAVFADLDNDGDLDLFLANRGSDLMFWQTARRQYRLDADFMEAENTNSMFWHHYLNVYSTGCMRLDMQNDGDLDLLIGSYDSESYLIANNLNTLNYIGFRLHGTYANPSAIGAMVYLYPAGEGGKSHAVLSSGMIESVSGYASHSQKLVHFGVDSSKLYDARVVFPGGKSLMLKNLQASRYYDIQESTGWRASLWRAWRKYRNMFFGYRQLLLFGQVLSLLVLGFVAISRLRKKLWWEKSDAILLWAAFGVGLLGGHRLSVYANNFVYFGLPLVFSVVFAVVLIVFLATLRKKTWPERNFETLAMKLASFAHSTGVANLFGSLDLLLNNLPVNQAIDADFSKHGLNTIQSFKTHVAPEIESVLAMLAMLDISRDQAMALARNWKRLSRLLSQLRLKLSEGKTPDAATIAKMQDHLLQIRKILVELRQVVAHFQSCEVGSLIDGVVRARCAEPLQINWQNPEQDIWAYVPASELRKIIDELITNAGRAMRHCEKQEIDIRVHERDRVVIEVSDSGCGVPLDKWDAIFSRNFSSRRDGGLGLYHARYTLEKYLGRIEVKESLPDQGTIFRIILEKAAFPKAEKQNI